MSGVLNRPVGELLDLSNPDFHRTLRAVELNSGMTYMEGYDRITKATEDLGPSATVGKALEAAGISAKKLDAIAQDVRTLEKADEARAAIRQLAADSTTTTISKGDAAKVDPNKGGRATPKGAENFDPDGNAKIDGETYEAVLSAPVKSRRLFEARKLVGGEYDGEAGASKFSAEDRASAEMGVDLLKTLQARRGRASTANRAQAASRRLEAAITRGKSAGERRKLLDEELTAGEMTSLASPAPKGTKASKMSKKARGIVKQLDKAGVNADDAVWLLSQDATLQAADPKATREASRYFEYLRTLEQ